MVLSHARPSPAIRPGSLVDAAGTVELVEVTRQFDGAGGVRDFSLRAAGEFLTLVGPSGSGKTTTLRLISGLLQPATGQVWLNGADVTMVPAYRRPVHTVFQHYALFPHLTVGENIAYPLALAGMMKAAQARRVDELLELVRLPGMASRRPDQLSGGQQQRVALARALATRPPILLLDEPLGALDVQLRQEMQIELKAIRAAVGATFIAVTHDQQEALATADRMAVMRGGRLIEIGTPRELYTQPRTRFVAEFVGQHAVLAGIARGEAAGWSVASLPDGTLVRGRCSTTAPVRGAAVGVAVRPEVIRLRAVDPGNPTADNDQTNQVPVTIAAVSFAGASWRIETRLRSGERLTTQLPAGWEDSDTWRPGEAALACFAPGETLILADERGN